jgi:hypothetical protein
LVLTLLPDRRDTLTRCPRNGQPGTPGKPIQNAFIKIYNERLREELLNETIFSSLTHARSALSNWRGDYNNHRPQSGLSGLTRAEAASDNQPPTTTTKKTAGANLKLEKLGGKISLNPAM